MIQLSQLIAGKKTETIQPKINEVQQQTERPQGEAKIILQYVKKGKKKVKKAMLVSVLDGDKVRIGWSSCCPRDNFNKKRGLDIALGRARKNMVKVIPSLKEAFTKFVMRNKRYYKDKEIANDFVLVDSLKNPTFCEVLKIGE